jgi:anaerobic ribonucleoside-triphosphate reductase activating protein
MFMEKPMPELTLTLDALTGTVLVEEHDDLPQQLRDSLTELFGPGTEIGCARPSVVLPPPEVSEQDRLGGSCLRASGYYHNSLVEGPGRRSSLLVSGCELACRGCWVPFLHPAEAGALIPVDWLADALLDPAYERDGVSILGGEPMQQPEGVLALVRTLQARGCPHILVYSGYTYERLRRTAEQRPAIGAVLDEINVLIDGPYVEALADRAGRWMGSRNQRVIDLVATRWTRRVVLLDDGSPDGYVRQFP